MGLSLTAVGTCRISVVGVIPARNATQQSAMGTTPISIFPSPLPFIAAYPSHLSPFNSRFTLSTENFSGSNLPPIHSTIS
jgi:hypothetical protein